MSTSPIPPHYLANTAAALGAFVTLNNIYGALNPRGVLNQLGFPIPISSSDQTLVNGVTRMFATTRIVVGVATLVMWWFRNYRALGVSMLTGCLMGVSDGFVSRKVIGKGEWGHWGGAPIGAVLGLGLLLAGDE